MKDGIIDIWSGVGGNKSENRNCHMFRRKVYAIMFFWSRQEQEVGAPSSFAWDQKGYDPNKIGPISMADCVSASMPQHRPSSETFFHRREDRLLKPNGIILSERIDAVEFIQTPISTPMCILILVLAITKMMNICNQIEMKIWNRNKIWRYRDERVGEEIILLFVRCVVSMVVDYVRYGKLSPV